MNPAIKKLWLEALRSGQYKKGTSRLRTNFDDGSAEFCCLGVLCNLHAQAHPELAAKETNPRLYMGQNAYAPSMVTRWAGLPLSLPDLTIMDTQNYIAYLNDSTNTFGPVIDWIEQNL
jgi:hypothetical protein